MEQGSGKKLWVVVAVLLVLIAGAASAAYYFISSSAVTIDSPSTDFVSASPTSGWWDLYFAAGVENLVGDCPAGGPGGVAWGNGQVRLSVSELGDTAVLGVESSNIYFSRTLSGNNNLYTSAPMLYTTRGGSGMVYFDFGANTVDSIIGTIHWFGSDGCDGEYPFTMELTQADIPLDTDPPTLLPGQWNMSFIDIDDLACDPTIFGFTALPTGTVTVEHITDLDTGQPDPGSILISGSENNFSLDVVTDTNVYDQTTETVDLGNPVDGEGDILLDYVDDGITFSGEMDLIVTSETTATGTFEITSSSGCSFAVPFTMTAV